MQKTRGYLNISHLLIYVKGIKDTENKLILFARMMFLLTFALAPTFLVIPILIRVTFVTVKLASTFALYKAFD